MCHRFEGRALSPLHRAYFLMVGLFAMWVGVWGTFMPSRVALALPWQVPALHSRVIGAMYLSGLLLMLACLLRRHAHQVAVGMRMAVVWTGMLLLASLLHLQEFDAHNPRVWFWFFAYLLFLAPQTMTQVWPWKASVLLQIYAGRRTLQ